MTATETRLLELCAQRFHKQPSELRPEGDVFESLGIDSMGALSLLSELISTAKISSDIPNTQSIQIVP